MFAGVGLQLLIAVAIFPVDAGTGWTIKEGIAGPVRRNYRSGTRHGAAWRNPYLYPNRSKGKGVSVYSEEVDKAT
jgi:hypothetical protein